MMGARDAIGRRGLVLGVVGTAAANALTGPAIAAEPAAASASFTVRSADRTLLTGDAEGDLEAPGILFIHGLRQSRLSWDKQFADPALAGFRLVRFDLRGHGDSDKPAAPDAYA